MDRKEYLRQYHLAHAEERNAKSRDYYNKNRSVLNEQRRKKIKESPEIQRAYDLWSRHKMRPIDYEFLWESQSGKCYLCKSDLIRGSNTHVEHDHRCCSKNRSCEKCRRGLACRACNSILGFVNDDMQKLRLIADNLEKKLEEVNDKI